VRQIEEHPAVDFVEELGVQLRLADVLVGVGAVIIVIFQQQRYARPVFEAAPVFDDVMK
jgi:hypothetical protein